QYSGMNAKSFAEFDRLGTFFKDPLFHSEDAIRITHACESKLLNKYLDNKMNPFLEEHGWQESMARICLPKEKKWASEEDAPELQIPGVYHCSLVHIITAVLEDDVTQTFNMMPFSQHWKVSEEKTIQVFSEAHSSPVMLDAYVEVNTLPHKPDDNLEHVVASLMFWSDSTHLTNFGDTSMWPFYLFFGNQSKYTCGKPTTNSQRMSSHCLYTKHEFHYLKLNIGTEAQDSSLMISINSIWGCSENPRRMRCTPTASVN
ncbi:hypothetical protein BDR03DRAFT_873697, partial [Suillus americanus]